VKLLFRIEKKKELDEEEKKDNTLETKTEV
jgi:hypothetical protein